MVKIKEALADMAAHTNCEFYTTNGAASVVETLCLQEGECEQRTVREYEIVLLLSGTVHLLCKGEIDQTVSRKNLFLLCPGSDVLCTAHRSAYMLICRIDKAVNYCKYYGAAGRQKEMRTKRSGFTMLGFKTPILRFAEGLAASVENGMLCRPYLTAKFTELLFLLRAYYDRRELTAFFTPFNSKDADFRANVYKYIGECGSVKELAAKLHLTEVGLRKKFVREFSVSPRDFLLERRKSLMLHEVQQTAKPFRQICDEYAFSSQDSLTRFCKVYLGDTPTAIREKVSV
ncbi:helix-turn-helix domain-containing protein [uncultured Alistipes sp.]|jgi:transcription regulator|uniref:helix-turn-helix domain-containing protein n=1 Tax=uncultured Alistipes sp. TaxID=538949 RepID=UPI0025DDD05F|nr:helix-turn-helix domain-containing protein [uncultured Alistipes sp.]